MEQILDASQFANQSNGSAMPLQSVIGVHGSIMRAVEALDRATTPASVWQTLKGFAAMFGFDYMLVLKGQQELALNVTPAILYNDMPDGFAEAFDRAGHSSNNPLVLRAFTQARPFTASELWAARPTERQKRALALLGAALNVRDGFMVPIHTASGLEGIVLMGGLKPETLPIVRSSLHVLAQCAFERVIELTSTPSRREPRSLSPREAECLRWAAAGKTDNEIGTILSISPRTARFHIENAKKKFGVATRIQAVTEALRRKLFAA